MTSQEYQSLLAQLRADLVPVGAIFAFPSLKVPEGYLPCDGRELSKASYPELYATIGTVFGGTDKTFCLPDLQGQFIRGYDASGDVDPEREFASQQEDAFQGHSHQFNPEGLSLKNDGGHNHALRWRDMSSRYGSSRGTYSVNQKLPASETYYNSFGDSRLGEFIFENGTLSSGTHTHILSLGTIKPVGQPDDSLHGRVKVACETRPKNVALQFCMKVK
ncbi:MAG: phage tail protein [Bacteroidales bacterium]|nr:phage tail protein [Bacteroidales bacterium]